MTALPRLGGPRSVLPSAVAQPLFDVAVSRQIERAALAAHSGQGLLMQRAGLAVAQLALATVPHASRIWIAAGPGNNGGDGLEAACHLRRAGKTVQVWLGADAASLPADARAAFARAHAAGVAIGSALPASLDAADLVVDALLGLGANRAPQGSIEECIRRINACRAPVIAVDLPSGLHADTGATLGRTAVRASHTLCLLTLKPGLFTAMGRDHAGQVWLDTLGVDASPLHAQACAWLGPSPARSTLPPRQHAQHKGSFGDVLVVGGAPGMNGAATLAARAAAAAGAGRVYVGLLDEAAPRVDLLHPELMFRPRPWLEGGAWLATATSVCGCGAGAQVGDVLPLLLSRCEQLVLDADALNAVARDDMLQTLLKQRAARGLHTILTPHPLESARLLDISTAQVQADRLASAQRLSQRFDCLVLLKGSGTVLAVPGSTPFINATGNALLASAGTGDVLAGWIAGHWSQFGGSRDWSTAWAASVDAASLHGWVADQAAASGRQRPLRADALIEAMHAAG